MQPLRDAIKQKYGVSDDVSNQVINGLKEIEKQRQVATGSEVHGFRARQPGDAKGTKEVPDMNTIIRDVSGGRQTTTSSRNVSVQGSGLIGVIISIVMSLIQMFLGSRSQTQGSGSNTVANILTDLTGEPRLGQAPDLGSILGTLISSNGSGSQVDIGDLMTNLLGDESPSTGQLTRPKSR